VGETSGVKKEGEESQSGKTLYVKTNGGKEASNIVGGIPLGRNFQSKEKQEIVPGLLR